MEPRTIVKLVKPSPRGFSPLRKSAPLGTGSGGEWAGSNLTLLLGRARAAGETSAAAAGWVLGRWEDTELHDEAPATTHAARRLVVANAIAAI